MSDILKDLPLLNQLFLARGGLAAGVQTALAIVPGAAGGMVLFGAPGSFTTLTASGLVRFGTATTADATSDVLIATSTASQRGLTIQAKAAQTGTLLRIVESSNNTSNNGWDFAANEATVTTSGIRSYMNGTTQIGALGYVIKWSSSASNPFATETASIRTSTGTPEGVVTARVGSLFLRSDGGASTCLYIKESGTGNTGWVAK